MNKNAYLTVDDAPSADFIHRLQYLKSRQLPAVIFCIGQQLLGHEEEVIEAIKHGV